MPERKGFLRSVGIVSALTLVSRLLGLARDVLSARAFGVGTTWSAFSVAWRIPNLFRRLFGEGALSASFIPIFTEYLKTRPREEAARLWGAVTALLAAILGLLLLIGEGIVLAVWALGSRGPDSVLLLGLTAVMLPYAFFICLVALKSAVLQSLGRFTVPALAPVVLNVCWIAAVAAVVPHVAGGARAQVFVLASAILLAGVLQLALQFPALKRAGFRLRLAFDLHHPGVRRLLVTMLPMVAGLAIFQLNVLLDSIIAWSLAARPGGPQSLNLFGWRVGLPMSEGAAAALYWADRLYEFPVGVFGVAVATVVFPALSAHAASGAADAMLADLRRALRIVLFIALPASVGIILLRHPIVSLFYGRGEFLKRPDSVARVARILAFYAGAIWVYCADQVLVRGFYAMKDAKTPVKVGASVVALNLALNLTFIWFLAEAGLALATAIAAAVRLGVLGLILRRRVGRVGGRELVASAWRSVAATAAMAAAVVLVMRALPPPAAGAALAGKFTALALPLAAGTAAYLAAAALLRAREMRELTGR